MSVEWHFLITLNEQLRPLKDPVEIQEVAVRLIGEHLHASRVNYAHIDGDEFVISRSYADGVPPFAGRGPVARFGKAIVDACRRGETVAVDDVKTDPRFTDAEREQLLAGADGGVRRHAADQEWSMAGDIRRPQRHAADLDARSDRIG